MRKLLFLLLVATASAQSVPVTGHLIDGSGNTYTTAFLRFQLWNCGANYPIYTGHGMLMVQQQFDLHPNLATGLISGSVIPNDEILCGRIASTRWIVTPMKDSVTPLGPSQRYYIQFAGGTFDPSIAMPDSTIVAPFAGFVGIAGNPSGSQTVNQPMGTSMVFTGTFDFTGATLLGVSTNCSGGNCLADPGSAGLLFRTTPSITRIAANSDVVGLFSGTPTSSLFLRADGQLAAPSFAQACGNPANPGVAFWNGTACLVDPDATLDGNGNLSLTSITASGTITGTTLASVGPGGILALQAQQAPATIPSGQVYCYFDQTTTFFSCLKTGGVSAVSGTQTIANGTAAMGTSAIPSGTCATVVTSSATGVLTTDTVVASPNADPTGVTGYGPSSNGSLYIQAWPTANNVNFKVCNNTAASITPAALTLNWRVSR